MTTDILPYRRMSSLNKGAEKEKGPNLMQHILANEHLLIYPLTFLLGRSAFIGGLMPFGFAFYAATLGTGINRVLAACCILTGMATAGTWEQLYITAAAMLLYNAFNIPFKSPKSKYHIRYAALGAASILVPSLVSTYLQGFLLFDAIRMGFNGLVVFLMVFIFRNVVNITNDIKKKKALTQEEIISAAITCALAVSGLGDLSIIGISLKNVICVFLVMTFSFRCGAGVGAAVGVTVGLIVSMHTTTAPMVISSYAFCGLLAGVLRPLGKAGVGLGFIMGNAILTLYINGSTEVLIYLKEIVIALIFFLVIPAKALDSVTEMFYRHVEGMAADKSSYSSRIREITVERLNKFSNAFRELSRTFNEISETRTVADKQDVAVLFDRVADKICKDCSLCMHCWDRNFYDTYQVMFKVFEKLDSKGRIEEKDVPQYFIDRCERIDDFVKEINNVYEIYKVDMAWKNKIGESRGLVSQQLEGLSHIISNLAVEINANVHFDSSLEERVIFELNKENMKVRDVVVYENKSGKYEVCLSHKGCSGKRDCIHTLERAISHAIGRKVVKDGEGCRCNTKTGVCNIKFIEEETFKVITGIAKASKNNGAVSGDHYTFMNTGDGKYIVALSDGMGSGHKAALQSKATISLIEQFMEAGFDKDTTIKLINSILVLKSGDDSYATIDLSIIDLYNGQVEFVKMGTVPTYIKRQERVELVKSASLPAGILSNVDLELISKKVESGDLIVMMSDGVLDAFKSDIGDEKNLQIYLDELKSMNPQEIANAIMDKAYVNSDSNPADDMMVVVSKVWKKAG